jgi:hypothetical protein
MLGLIKGRAAMVVGGILLATFLSMAGVIAWQVKTIRTERAEATVLELRLATAIEINETNVGAINELQKANADLVERIRLDAVAAADAARAAGERAAALERARDEARARLRDALSSEPSCEDLAKLDLAAACPAFGDRLLELQRRTRPH